MLVDFFFFFFFGNKIQLFGFTSVQCNHKHRTKTMKQGQDNKTQENLITAQARLHGRKKRNGSSKKVHWFGSFLRAKAAL